MKTFSFIINTLIIVAVALVLAACGNNTGSFEKVTESTIEQVQKRGILRVGMSTFVPWAMKDKTGKLIGFEIDVATRLAQDM